MQILEIGLPIKRNKKVKKIKFLFSLADNGSVISISLSILNCFSISLNIILPSKAHLISFHLKVEKIDILYIYFD